MTTWSTDRAANREGWRAHITAWQACGQSQQHDCDEHRLTLSSFSRWRRIFLEEDSVVASPSASFVVVRWNAPASAGAGVTLVLANGVPVEVPLDFDGTTLERVLTVAGQAA